VRRAVTLVHIEIDYRHLQRLAFARPVRLQHARSDCNVIENTKTTTLVRVSMVGTTCQAGTYPSAQCRARSRHRGANRAPCPLRHGLTPRKTDLSRHRSSHRSVRYRFNVSGRMHQKQLRIAGSGGLQQLNRWKVVRNRVTQHGVLRHREAVALRQRKHELIAVKRLHA